MPTVSADPARLREELSILAESFHATEARVLGGEPLLHPDIVAVLASVRDSGICDSIRVITNGLLLPRVQGGFWEVVDEVSVSVYPGRELPTDTAKRLEATAATHGVRLKFKRFDCFRESYSEMGTTDGDLVERVFRTCQLANVWRCITVWQGRLYRCPQSLFLPTALNALKDAVEGIEISRQPDFLDSLVAFLESDEPLASCRYCLGSVGRLYRNEQVRRGEWRDHQGVPSEQLLDEPQLAYLEANPTTLVQDTSYLPASS
jgi:hypothetical protein